LIAIGTAAVLCCIRMQMFGLFQLMSFQIIYFAKIHREATCFKMLQTQ
jgi:hypothetical protein